MKRSIHARLGFAALLAATLLAVTATAQASAASAAPTAKAPKNPLCSTLPPSTPPNMAPVWVRLSITTQGGQAITQMGSAVRRYLHAKNYKVEAGIFPGCNELKLYTPTNVPHKLCVYVPPGYVAVGDPCQKLVAGIGGAWEVDFYLKVAPPAANTTTPTQPAAPAPAPVAAGV